MAFCLKFQIKSALYLCKQVCWLKFLCHGQVFETQRCWTHEERKYGVSTLQWRTNFWLLIQTRKIDAHYQRPIRSRRTQKLKPMRPQCRAPDKSLQLQLILFWGEFAVYCLLINAKMWLSSVIVNHISWGWREGLADKSICHSFRTKMWFPALTMVAQNHL